MLHNFNRTMYYDGDTSDLEIGSIVHITDRLHNNVLVIEKNKKKRRFGVVEQIDGNGFCAIITFGECYVRLEKPAVNLLLLASYRRGDYSAYLVANENGESGDLIKCVIDGDEGI